MRVGLPDTFSAISITNLFWVSLLFFKGFVYFVVKTRLSVNSCSFLDKCTFYTASLNQILCFFMGNDICFYGISTLVGNLMPNLIYMICKHILYITFLNKPVCLFGFYGILTFVGYLMPNPFLYKWTVLFPTIQFSISTQFVKNISISSYSV